MRLVVLAVLAGCYRPPTDLEIVRDLDEVGTLPCAPARDERVSCVVDGDTLDLRDCGQDNGERVRMLGIDAPEVAHDGEPAECYADNAHAELLRLVDGERVLLTFDSECEGLYDRTLAYVWLYEEDARRLMSDREVDELLTETADGPAVLVNEYMLRYGYAELYDEAFADELSLMLRLRAAVAEAEARLEGLWATCVRDG